MSKCPLLGGQPSRRERQQINVSIFHKDCIKVRTFWALGSANGSVSHPGLGKLVIVIETGELPSLTSAVSKGGSRFFIGGSANPIAGGATIRFCYFFPEKLHEIEKIYDRNGAAREAPPTCANDVDLLFGQFFLKLKTYPDIGDSRFRCALWILCTCF